MDAPPRVLIVAMTSGESDLPFHVLSASSQEGVIAERVEIAGLSNLEAHRACYQTIMDRSGDFDTAIKLDGDMVLRGRFAARDALAPLRGDIDMITYPVLDFLTSSPLTGMHVFSPRCRWDLRELAEPFVDPNPQFPGRRVKRPLNSWAPALHGYFMSLEQAFAFGLHRGHKCFVPQTAKAAQLPQMLLPVSAMHYRTLLQIWRLYRTTRDPLRGAAIVAAETMRRARTTLGLVDYKRTDNFSAELTLARGGDHAEIDRYCAYWSSPGHAFYRRLARPHARMLGRLGLT